MYEKNFEIRKEWALVALVILSTSAFPTVNATNDYGCLYDNTVCSDEEFCFNDGMFGACRSTSDLADWLSPEQTNGKILEELLSSLWRDRHRRQDEYTQCVIGCMLENVRNGLLYDPNCCAHILKPSESANFQSDDVAPQIFNVDPGDQAYIRFKPNLLARDGGFESRRNDGETYADEVFAPPISTSTSSAEDDQDPRRQLRTLGALASLSTQTNELSGLSKRQTKAFEQGPQEEEEGEEKEDPLAKIIQYNLWATENSDEDLGETISTPLFDDPKFIEKRSFLENGELFDDDAGDSQESDTFRRFAAFPEEPESEAVENIGDSKEGEDVNLDEDTVAYGLALDKSSFVSNSRNRAAPFRRLMRFDTKKPGPGYFYRELDADEEDEREYWRNLRRLRAYKEFKQQIQAELDNPDNGSNEIGKNGQKRDTEVAETAPGRVPERHAKGMLLLDPYSTEAGIKPVDSNTAYMGIERIDKRPVDQTDANLLTITLEKLFQLPTGTISQLRLDDRQVAFKVLPNEKGLNATEMISRLGEDQDEEGTMSTELQDRTNLTISSAGIGDKVKYELIAARTGYLFLFTFGVCGLVVGVLLAISAIYVVRRHQLSREKLRSLNGEDDSLTKFDYQDLCRQRMADSGKGSPLAAALESGKLRGSPKKAKTASQQSDSSRSSTSSWSEEPVATSMDISTGHMILSYMEDHIKSKNRLEKEWESLCAYEADPASTAQAQKEENIKKSRYSHSLPYDHSRIILNDASNPNASDYINASAITDHDPRNPAYIATQGPLAHTAADFWQMVWEQGGVVVVTLTRLMENGVSMCHRYWPEEGSETCGLYEVHLVSEHVWCDDYLVRSFYLKNLKTSETRTVTQFHFVSWPENGVPPSTKSLLDFRRKVNRSYRGRSCPIVVHCSDGCGRTGAYVLMDMVLNRIAKGAKEIDVAATLEHLRDQRVNMVKTKAQFEFVLMAVAEEVHAILKSLSTE